MIILGHLKLIHSKGFPYVNCTDTAKNVINHMSCEKLELLLWLKIIIIVHDPLNARSVLDTCT